MLETLDLDLKMDRAGSRKPAGEFLKFLPVR